tara:strand:+ start:1375 stop:2097 length:723 start_codon:yes stop_codon:yes gene_type:complete
MSNKILVFGGTGSIGKALSKKLKKDNYEPIILSRNEEELKVVSKEIDCDYKVCDVLDLEKVKNISEEFKDDIYGIAYCVGSINLKPIKISKDEDYIESFKINTLGAINIIRLNYESLAKKNGSILLYSTIAVKQGFTNHTIVSTAKGAIEGLTLSLAAEFAPKIRVNCIAPSLTDAKMTKKIISNDNIKKAIETMHPIPKIGSGEDFSDIGSFLLSEKNSWITGQIFHIDGGRSSLRIKS